MFAFPQVSLNEIVYEWDYKELLVRFDMAVFAVHNKRMRRKKKTVEKHGNKNEALSIEEFQKIHGPIGSRKKNG